MTNTTPLVVVLGAGASKEANLPTGMELIQLIARALNFKIDDFGQVSGGDNLVRECLFKLSQSSADSLGTYEEYIEAAISIKEAMPLALSIDNYIDNHRHDKRIAQIGKIAIATCILKAERDSSLYVDRSNFHNRLDFSRLGKTWFGELFRLISQHCSKNDLAQRFSTLTIVSFNYDRCAKHFILEALITSYSLTPSDAEKILSKITFYYPYGSVGQMPFETSERGLHFGEQPTSDSLIKSAERLKTFTEGTDQSISQIDDIRSCIAETKTLVFLGFAFHPLNLNVLYGDTQLVPYTDHSDVFATALGISDSNTALILNELATFGGYNPDRLRLRQDLTAANLIIEYSRHLARGIHSAA